MAGASRGEEEGARFPGRQLDIDKRKKLQNVKILCLTFGTLLQAFLLGLKKCKPRPRTMPRRN
jgi:hypothetical protein